MIRPVCVNINPKHINSIKTKTGTNSPDENSNAKFQPSFKASTLGESLLQMGTYAIVDIAAIYIACTLESAHNRSKDEKMNHDYGLRVFNRDHPELALEVRTTTSGIVAYLNKQEDKRLKAVAQNIKGAYTKYFQDPLAIKSTTQSIHIDSMAKALETMSILYRKVDDVFVDIDDAEIDNAVARPFLETLKKSAAKIRKVANLDDINATIPKIIIHRF